MHFGDDADGGYNAGRFIFGEFVVRAEGAGEGLADVGGSKGWRECELYTLAKSINPDRQSSSTHSD